MSIQDGNIANVIAYANPFPSRPRIEILVDWIDISSWKTSDRLSFNVYVVAQDKPPSISNRANWNQARLNLGNRFLSNDLWLKYRTQFSGLFDEIHPAVLSTQSLDNFLSIGAAGTVPSYDLAEGPHPYFDVTLPRNSDSQQRDLNVQYSVYAKRLLDWRRKLHELSDQRHAANDEEVDPIVSPNDRLMALRHACRDEVTLGSSLNVLHFFELNELNDSIRQVLRQKVVWLVALPIDQSGTPLNISEFVPIPSRLASDGTTLITCLEEMPSTSEVNYDSAYESYWPKTVAIRQLISAEIPDPGDHDDHKSLPKAVLQVIERHSVAPSLSVSGLKQAAKHLVRQEQGLNETQVAERTSEIVEGVRTMESGAVPYDKIGISWDRKSVMPKTAPEYHRGYKGYRLDVFSVNGAKTESLCEADIRITTPSNAQFDLRESILLGITEGYVDITVQKDPTAPAATPASGFAGQELALARDFALYDGYSSVAQNPLDSLAKVNSIEVKSSGVVTLQNIPNLNFKLKYGNNVAIQVRKVGMTGIGPQPGYVGKITSANSLTFKRTVPMTAPEVQVACKRLTPQSAKGSDTTGPNQPALRISGNDPEIVLNVRYPASHWKVAWHARGDMGDTLDPDFQSACEEFARRSVRRQLAGDEGGRADYLHAVDPHLSGVQVITRIWYPFSNNKSGNRYVVTGRKTFSIEAAKNSFPQLVAKAEKRVRDRDFDIETQISVFYTKEFTYKAAEIQDPFIIVGHRNQIECSGEWDNSSSSQLEDRLFDELDLAKKTEDKRDLIESRRKGITPWVWNLRAHPQTDLDKPFIGGTVDKPPEALITIHYAGLRTRHLERWLPVPPTKGTPPSPGQLADSCKTTTNAINNPARGSTFQWRNFVFPAKDAPVGGDLRKRYVDFVLGMLGPSEAVNGKDDASGILSVRIMPSDMGLNFVAVGFSFPVSVSVTEAASGSVRYDEAILGQFSVKSDTSKYSERQLPFIDDDINWIVRLEWKFPIIGSHIQHPYDLAAVKEFQIYRTQAGKDVDSKLSPIGAIARPSEMTLQTYNLDEVSWVFFDSIRDRDKHDFLYHVVAVPEDEEAFKSKEWASFAVAIPSSRFDSRPEPVQILPMFPEDDVRRVAIRVPKPSDFLLAWRLSSARRDPLLPPPPSVTQAEGDFTTAKALEDALVQAHSGSPLPAGLDELFPNVQPASESIFRQRPPEPFKKIDEGWAFASGAIDDTSSTAVWVQKIAELPLGNPFFKLQVVLYSSDPAKYPCLAHTAPSEVFQTNWIQGYPGDLQFDASSLSGSAKEIKIQNSWSFGSSGELLCYRYHFFAVDRAQTEGANAAFHISTFYFSQPNLSIAMLRPKLQAAFRRFVVDDLKELNTVDVYVVVEEGLVAPTYSIDEANQVQASAEKVFVTLRASKSILSTPASIWV